METEQSVGERIGGFLFVRLHLSAYKCDSCLPSLSLYFNIYFAPTDAAMLATLFKTKKTV